jgi:hypothetical protein
MMLIDATAQFVPMYYAMVTLLVVSAAAVAAEPMSHVVRQWMRTFQPRITIRRPALGHSR